MSALAQLASALRTWAARGEDDPSATLARRLAGEIGLRAVVLVEGVSDREAVEAVARSQGRHLAAEGLCVLPMGGATNVRRYLALLGPAGLDVRVTGLYDAAEEPFFRRALAGTDTGRPRPGRTWRRPGSSPVSRTSRRSSSGAWGRRASRPSPGRTVSSAR